MILEKTLKKLEYGKILQEISTFARSEIAKRRILAILPCEDFESAKKELQLTEQLSNLVRYDASFHLAIDDVTEICALARVSSVLSMKQLLCVMRQMRTARLLRATLSKEYENIDTSMLLDMANLLYCDKYLEDEIDFAIVSDDEMNDKASSELYSIRKKIKGINADIKQKLHSYTRQGEMSKYLQDTIVTMRGDRFVIPVKAEYRSLVSGIVHDQSSSGSTIFIEPVAIVQLNNDLRIAIAQERDEINRILTNFTQKIAPHTTALLKNQDVISKVDSVFSKVQYGEKTRSTLPLLGCDGVVELKNARHPLIDPKKVVPISVTIGEKTSIVVITGPNTGGKTVTEKTVGLLTLMAMSGMLIPAVDGSKLSFFKDIFCDIGDEQSIEQNLSTFSSHITNIKFIISKATKDALVLIDEVGAGTEPNEGSALALAITDKLLQSGAKCMITTHYSELKEYSLVTSGVENASMEFDSETFAPTYKLVMGVPGSSNAIAIAQKLGLQLDVVEKARNNLSAEKVSFEKVLQNAETIRKHYEDQKELVQREKERLEKELQKAQEMTSNLLQEREKLLKTSKQEAKRIVSDAKEEANELLAYIKQLINKGALEEKTMFEIRGKIKTLQNKQFAQETEEEYIFTGDPVSVDRISEGDVVYSKTLGVDVKIVSIKGKKITVKAGNISTIVNVSDLFECIVEKKEVSKKHENYVAKTQINSSREQKSEINLLGQTILEAIENVDSFLDGATLCGLHKVWLIHGKGSGKLKKGLHEHLKKHPLVKSFRLGEYGEGEDGVTVVELK